MYIRINLQESTIQIYGIIDVGISRDSQHTISKCNFLIIIYKIVNIKSFILLNTLVNLFIVNPGTYIMLLFTFIFVCHCQLKKLYDKLDWRFNA